MATYGRVTKTANLTVKPASLAALMLSLNQAIGGNSTTSNTVTLNGHAPARGALVTLTGENTAVASVPSSVTAWRRHKFHIHRPPQPVLVEQIWGQKKTESACRNSFETT